MIDLQLFYTTGREGPKEVEGKSERRTEPPIDPNECPTHSIGIHLKWLAILLWPMVRGKV